MIENLETKRRQKTRLLFIYAFLRLMEDREIDKITVTDIADEANYGRWAFYQYFQSKEEVAYAAFLHWMTQLDNYVINAIKDFESPQREYESWRIIFRAFEQQKLFFTRLGHLSSAKWKTEVKEFLIQQFLQHLREGHFKLMQDVRPEIAARLYVAAFIEMLEYWRDNPESGDLDALVTEFFIFIFKQPPFDIK